NIGTGNGTNAINIGTGTGADTINIGNNNTLAETITLGNSLATLNLASTTGTWTMTTTNALTIASSTASTDRLLLKPQTTSVLAANNGTITSADLTAARTWTFPDTTGVVLLDTTLSGTFFAQGGNSFGGLATLGTNDAFALAFETGTFEQMRLHTDGTLHIGETPSSDQAAILYCREAIGTGYAIFGENTSATSCTGVYGSVTGTGAALVKYGVYGYTSGQAADNRGVYGNATGAGTINYGVYGTASGGTTNWAGYFNGSTKVVNDSATTGTVLDVSSTSLTSGQGIRMQGPTGGATMTGRLIYAAGDFGNSGSLLEASGTFRANAGFGYGLYVTTTNAASGGEPDVRGLYSYITDATTTGADNVAVYGSTQDTGVSTTGTEDNYGGYFRCSQSGLATVGSTNRGVYAYATGNSTSTAVTYGVYAQGVGTTNGTSTAYGIYATASGADTNWAGYFSGDVNLTGGGLKGCTDDYAESEAAVFTASTTYQTKTSLALSAGTYIVFATAEMYNDTWNNTAYARLFNITASATYGEAIGYMSYQGVDYATVSWAKRITLAAAQTIALQYKAAGASSDWTYIRNARIFALRVD
ncbi:MAG: hypothetical protein RDV41_14140, partial [Planctomycetota bacterium]|nr:hypothetical protein [Planctomycetota bacterium]